MKRRFVFVFLVGVALILQAQTAEEFMRQQREQQAQFMQEQNAAFSKFHNQQDSLFIQYKDEIERQWNEFKESTQKEWVSYSEDFSSRSQVNFETGEVQVDAVVPSDEANAEQKAVKLVKEQLESIVKEKDETNAPILEDQLQDPVTKKVTLTPKNIEKLAEKIVKKAKKTKVKGADNKTRVKYSISLSMVPNHIQKRAAKYKPYIEKKCQHFKVKPSVVLAIVHTESFFNPKAYNRHGNAYGMMQIVPKYAGLTMNNVLYKKNSKPTSDDLFNPEKNLEMGIGYIRWLADNKWKEVTNTTNQYYCIICSYNGGVGSVYKAMMGKMRGIKQAEMDEMRRKLSTMNSDKLYQKLRKDIPWEETRKYIKLVKERIDDIYASVEK